MPLCTVLPSVYSNREMRWLYGLLDVTFCGTSQDGHTPLMMASGGGRVECVKLLLIRGAQANLRDKVSSTVLISNQCLLLDMIPCVKRA